MNIRTVQVIRYITPLREGGSMPAIVEADDGFKYALKFRGAGQGPRALIAELIGGLLAKAVGLKVPELVFAQLDEAFGRTEPDEEIQDLLRASEGLNLAVHYLSGSITYDPAVDKIDERTASVIVWLDALLMNVDRTARNTNMLVWHKELWLIDYGASLYFHHSWYHWEEQSTKPFVQIKDHVLLPYATQLEQVDLELKNLLDPQLITDLVALIPEVWLQGDAPFESSNDHRNAYIRFLNNRIAHSSNFIKEANHARA